MKFRAFINDNTAIRDFTSITTSLSKFAKECVVRLTPRSVFFIISEEDTGPRRPLVWCELPVTFYFKEYNVVGVNEEFNEIYLEVNSALLARSLNVLKQNGKALKIKLTNKESPCLTLEMDLLAAEIQSRQCVHDVPIEIISRKHWGDYEEPHFNDFHVSIEMPNLKAVKNIVERLKNMGHGLTVKANKAGRFTLQIKTNMVSVSAHFANLSVESFAVGQTSLQHPLGGDEEDDFHAVSSTIDVKKFLMILSGMQLNNCRTLCSIVHEKMVKLDMEQPGAMRLQIFLNEFTI